MKPSTKTTAQPHRQKRYTRRTPTQWQSLIDLYEQSGQTQEAFCGEHGIPTSGFHAWRKRLAGPTKPSTELSPLIDITPSLSHTASETQKRSACQVELEIGGCLVRITTR